MCMIRSLAWPCQEELCGVEIPVHLSVLQASDTMNITATPEAGPWLITLDEPSYIAVLTFSANRQADPPACIAQNAGQGTWRARQPVLACTNRGAMTCCVTQGSAGGGVQSIHHARHVWGQR